MQIALCDDEAAVLNALDGFLRQYGDTHELTLSIDRFYCGEDLLASDKRYDMIFMDIYLTGVKGTEVIRQLSAAGHQHAAFITSSQDHAIEAFGLGAVHYLLKPLTQAGVSEAMDRCIASLGESTTQFLEVKTSLGITPVPIENIVYIEVFNKVCVIHTTKNTIQTYATLDGLSERLDAKLFLRAQRSFLVNMRYIESFSYDRLIMAGGTKVTLSRSNRAELKKQYLTFLFDLARRDGA